MIKFIPLTISDGDSTNINVSLIVEFAKNKDYTKLIINRGNGFYVLNVTQTEEEIYNLINN